MRSPPARVVWIEILPACGLALSCQSPPARVVWIEIQYQTSDLHYHIVATREGGVD